MSSLVLLLAFTASALDCAGFDPQLCHAANAAAEQINAAAGQQLVYDAHPSSRQRPRFLYNRFLGVYADAAAQCEWGFEIQGTLGAYQDRTQFGPRVFVGVWEDLDGTYGGALDGSWTGTLYTGTFHDDPEGRMGSYQAQASGANMWMLRDAGHGGGGKTWITSGVGFFGNFYGDCVQPPAVENDVYPVVGNTPLRVGVPAEDDAPAVELTGSVFDNDPDAGDLIVTGVNDGFAPCADDTAPFDCTTEAGGLVRVFEDGTFVHTPPPGAPADTRDSFGIAIARVGSAAATYSVVELQHVGRAWYADGNGSGGGGISSGPALTLEDIAGPIEPGDTVYIAGIVHAGAGLHLGGGVRILGGSLPLSVDGDLDGEPITVPVTTNFEPRGEVVVSGAPFATILAGSTLETHVSVEALELVGSADHQGMIHVTGPGRFDLTLEGVSMDSWGGYDAAAVRIEQPYGGQPYGEPPSTLTVHSSQFAGSTTAFDLRHGREHSTTLVLDDVQIQLDGTAFAVASTDNAVVSVQLQNSFVEATEGLFALELDRDTQTHVELVDVQGVVSAGDAFRITTTDGAQLDVDVQSAELEVDQTLFAVDLFDGARVQVDISDVAVEAGHQILRVANEGFGPGFGSYVENSELNANDGLYGPAIEISGLHEATNRIAMGNNVMRNAGGSGPSVRIQGDQGSNTAVTMLGNVFLRSPSVARAVEFRTNHAASRMCLDFESNQSSGGPLSLYQHPGSAFSIAGLTGNGTHAGYVASYLRSVNPQTPVRVQDQQPYGQVDFDGVAGCELP